MVKKFNVKTQWVRGHGTDKFNILCDRLANNARKGILIENLDKVILNGDTRIGTKKAGTVSIWHKGKLKVLDFDLGIIEDYNREVHGKRGSVIEIREAKER